MKTYHEKDKYHCGNRESLWGGGGEDSNGQKSKKIQYRNI